MELETLSGIALSRSVLDHKTRVLFLNKQAGKHFVKEIEFVSNLPELLNSQIEKLIKETIMKFKKVNF